MKGETNTIVLVRTLITTAGAVTDVATTPEDVITMTMLLRDTLHTALLIERLIRSGAAKEEVRIQKKDSETTKIILSDSKITKVSVWMIVQYYYLMYLYNTIAFQYIYVYI